MTNFIKHQLSSGRQRREFDVRISVVPRLQQLLQDGLTMKSNESLPKDSIHVIDSASVSPITVMHTSICDSFSFALQCSFHHMCRIQRVNKIGWKCCFLLLLGNRALVIMNNGYLLKAC